MNFDKDLFELMQLSGRLFGASGDQRGSYVATEFVGNCHKEYTARISSFEKPGCWKRCHSTTRVLRRC